MEILFKHNPWWTNKHWKDPDIEKFEQMKIKLNINWTNEISLKPYSLNFVYGPRQVGKTTGIKLLIKNLCEKRNPLSIFYMNCDLIVDLDHLKRVLDAYLEIKKKENIKHSFIFLDEISSVEKWWKIIKGYIDLGIFKTDVLTILGSSSFKIRRDSEQFPGRRGYGKNINVLPATFKDYVLCFGVKKYSEKIYTLFNNYLKEGGFPLSINKIKNAKDSFISAFESEINKLNKNIRIAKQILSSILRKAPSPLSYHTIASGINISHKTVAEYIDVFEELFLVKQAFYLKNKKIDFKKPRKVFFLDPFIAQTFSYWLMEDFLESAMYEWVVQAHLQRRYKEVYYSKDKYEIDCIAGNLKIEVKTGKPHRRYPKNTRVLSKEDIPLFLLNL